MMMIIITISYFILCKFAKFVFKFVYLFFLLYHLQLSNRSCVCCSQTFQASNVHPARLLSVYRFKVASILRGQRSRGVRPASCDSAVSRRRVDTTDTEHRHRSTPTAAAPATCQC